jgi:NADH:ubiquinone oxidoreductase subunit F (NADH-binding)
MGTTKVFILFVCFRMTPWLLSDSSKPWSCGMCSVCRDPKTQKWRMLQAMRGCPFGGQTDQNKR